MSLLDDAFELLEIATREEKSGGNRVEAATKYYEATYMLKTVLQTTPSDNQQIRALLEEKIDFYGKAANRLYFDDRSTVGAFQKETTKNPRSPTIIHRQGQPAFFNNNTSKVVITTELNQKVGQANTQLSQAMDLDESSSSSSYNKTEIIEAYMVAAQSYLGALKLAESCKSVTLAPVLKRRLEGALDRVEQLKSSPTTIPTSRDRQITTLPAGEEKSQSSLTEREIAVLKKSSLIASGVFLPFSIHDANKISTLAPLFTDPTTLELSTQQKKHFYKWARPSEIMQLRRKSTKDIVMIQSINPYSIRQKYVTDCSFIASLCICAAFAKRFRKRLISTILYPQNNQGIPQYNPSGKYIVKLWLNGVARQVVVDDRLAVDRNGRLLCSDTKTNNGVLELWVSIIEKAYMKLCGGYDFPGSNSGVDLFSLTGWIPERIFFPTKLDKVRDFETEPERAWERLFSANSFGDCLITVSTSRDISEQQAEQVGLITGHAYAVLDVVQTNAGTRLLQLKNPWASKGWKGKYSCFDTASWTQTLRQDLSYNPELAAQHDEGIFWISWNDVLKYFQNLQLSWNPNLFQYNVTTHDHWPKSQGPKMDTFNIGENPQYIMALSQSAVAKKATIWILISRHVAKQEQEGCEVNDFLTIHLYRNSKKKERIFFPHGANCVVNGAYTNNPHVLVRYDVEGPQDEYLSLVLSQHKKSQDMPYTLSCYCTESFSLGQPENLLPEKLDIAGQWTSQTAAGPVGSNRFFDNPMYLLRIEKETEMQLRCSTTKSCTTNVMLIALQKTDDSQDFRRMTQLYGKITLDSGNYRHGFAVTERKKIKPGLYTLVASNFTPGKSGVYSIKITSSSPVEPKEVPTSSR